jgi:phytanoyl-CoA hydroxylase
MAVAAPMRIDTARFEDEGYLLIEDVFDPQRDLDPVVDEYREVLKRVSREWHASGKIESTYAEYPFGQRLARVLNDAGPDGYRPFDITLSGKITEDAPMHMGPAVFNMIRNERLLDAVEQIVGSEILSNPIQHVRIKPPEALLNEKFHGRNTMVSATEWHQDQGVAIPEVDATEMLTVWFPVMDATIENGCLCVIPESHKKGLVTHCPSRPGQSFDLRIPEELRGAGAIPVPMKRGSVLFLHRRMMHSSLRNLSDDVRWSFDLRYQPVGQPTGRPWFPSFIVRSRQNPASEITDWRELERMWQATRTHLAAHPEDMKPRRWTGTESICA